MAQHDQRADPRSLFHVLYYLTRGLVPIALDEVGLKGFVDSLFAYKTRYR